MKRPDINVPVYLDYHATTPLDPRVLEVMMPWFTEKYGNPHSVNHGFGRDAAQAVEKARGQVASLIGAEPREIVFTSGATESNNLAIKGAARFERRHRNRRNRIVTLASEHKCVLGSAGDLAGEDFEIVVLPVLSSGKVDMDALDGAVDDTTILVSVMAANNEIGTLQPLGEIGALARSRGALFHTDAAQAAGKIPLDVEATGIDLMSISGHKLHGPKGVGALYVRRRPRARIEPLFSGGGQERTLRSGTVPAPLAVGLGEACDLARQDMADEAVRIGRLRDKLLDELNERVDGLKLNGDPADRLPGNASLAIAGVDALELVELASDLAISTGAACTSTVVEPSHVLRAIGLSDDEARSSVRLCIGRCTTPDEVEFAAEHLADAIHRCRAGSMAA